MSLQALTAPSCPEAPLDRRVAAARQVAAHLEVDALIVRDIASLTWLTGAVRTFDDEQPHVALVPAQAHKPLALHTDSRYFNTLVERGTGTRWQLDQHAVTPLEWIVDACKGLSRVAIEDQTPYVLVQGIQKELPELELVMMGGALTGLRQVKDASELAAMRHAQAITDAAFAATAPHIAAGATELEIRAELEYNMMCLGAEGFAFATIIAAGANGANPHAQPSSQAVVPGDLIVMDYGATYGGYHADMTRCVVVGEPSREQREVYEAVRAAHEAVASELRAGVRCCDMHTLAQQVLGSWSPYFGHGLGHGVGLEIHEGLGLNVRTTQTLPEGSIVTIEPGVYLPGKFGVRLEDYGVVTATGFEPFTKSSHELMVVAD